MARYYDTLYNQIVDYVGQTDHLEKILSKHHNGEVKSILDLACGTGNYTEIFAKRGYHAVGIDLSPEMIALARKKSVSQKHGPFYAQMDMRNFQLKEKFDAVTILFGGFGYITKMKEVLDLFSSVRSTLNPGGILVFEFWHDSAVLPESSFPEGRRNYDTIREGNRLIVRLNTSKYDAQSNLLTVNFDFYIIDTKSKKLLDDFSEIHTIKTYSIPEIRGFLEESRLKPLAFYEGGVGKQGKLELAKQSTFRVLSVARVKPKCKL
jgi:SAM-dependent methyltransferase